MAYSDIQQTEFNRATENLIEITWTYVNLQKEFPKLSETDSMGWKQMFVVWANEFEENYGRTDWDESEKTYQEAIEEFAKEKIFQWRLESRRSYMRMRRKAMEERRDIVYIGIDHIHTHPENPRKDLGDLTELAESMKKQGCLQNLTVVPVEEQPGEYYALIGNRRHGASKLAGLEELPCRIAEGLSRKEQLSIMLEENMQRSDLTIYEQAQGFQLMLDLGDTEEQIAEKTGFSKTTIRRRLNIAKLNQDELKKKEQDENFQLTLKDLYELEKVKDIKTRDKILREATSSRDLVSRAQAAAAEAKRNENAKN